ncbi:alpha/beta hydrolase [Litorilinea aerophila]|uniref:Alpha/beta hydrolase n=1 Tax=Litorilinea aerophila TaxID=1204385 RepID=A0A540VG83_9CHLR|nr:alpha/beta hydrolase [Litorilinea aerophila]MCC9076460.1 alpha/beta hydrolase [Litorilinea aerophila]
MSTRYLDVADGFLAYDDQGEGPLVVCVPSMGDLRAEYRYLVPQLVDAGYRVVTLDVRGHGESSVGWTDYSVAGVGSDLVALLRALDGGPAVLVGTSMAAGAAVWAAAEAPELVAGLVLVGPFVRGEPLWWHRPVYGALFRRPWGPAAWLWYYGSLYPSRKPADYEAYAGALRANLQEPGRFEALRQMIFASKRASEERIPRVQAPGLVLMGTRDPDFSDPGVEARWVADALGFRCHLVEGAGHYPHAEMPGIAGELIRGFLAEVWSQPAEVVG